jgi:hypothetical protein
MRVLITDPRLVDATVSAIAWSSKSKALACMKCCSALPNRPAPDANSVGVQGASQPKGTAPPQSGKHKKLGRAP